MTLSKTGRLAVGAVALAVVVSSAACSTEHSKQSSGQKVDTLNILASAPEPSFTRNFNAFSPATKKSPGAAFIYEPLVRVDNAAGNKVKSWLAKSFEYSDGGKTLTFKLRKNVTWSDGKPFTSSDVKYTLELPSKTEGLAAAPLPNLKSVSTPDKHTAVVNYSKPEIHDLTSYAGGTRRIVPKHLWNDHNPVKWQNKKPVGTGPFTFESFGDQSIKLKTRENYWHGSFHGVKYLNIKAYGSESAGQQMLLKNEVSWAGNSWQNYKSDFIKKDPKHNQYWTFPPGRSEGLVFNMKKAPTNNVHIRRALYAALDSEKLLKLFENGQKAASPTGLEPDVWAKYMPSSLRSKRHEQDAEKAKTELKKSGYKVKNGKLTKDGKQYPLNLTTNADYSNWVAWAPGMQSQWKKVLGIKVGLKKVPNDQYGERQANGKFQMLHDLLDNGVDIWSALNVQLGSQYRKPLGTRSNGNYGRYSNKKIDNLLSRMSKTRDEDELKKDVNQILDTVVKEVPYAPLHNGVGFIEINSTDWSGWPDTHNPKYYPFLLDGGPKATLTIQNLKPNATKKQ